MPFVFVLIAAVLLPGQTDQGRAMPPSAAEIDRAIDDLASTSFALRQQASDFLWQAGRAAEPALRRALESGDPEVVFRVKSILERFRYGVYPDTPPQIVRLIESFRDGDLAAKRIALQQLQQQGAVGTMLALLRGEPKDIVREQLVREFAKDVDTIVPDLIVAGELTEAENLLELAAGSTDEGMRHLAVLLLLTGKIEQRIAAEREELKAKPSDIRRRLLVYLLRAAGQSEAALAACDGLEETFDFMREGLRFERRDWPALARQYEETLRSNSALAANVEFLGFSAAIHRLAGDAAALERDLARIKELSGADAEQSWYCAEALLVNGRFDEGTDLLRETRPEAAFRLLAARLRYREAFELVGLDPKGENAAEWFRDLGSDLQSDDKELRERLGLGLAVARLISRLAGRDRAAECLAIVGEAMAQDDDGRRLELLCEAERKLGLDALAYEHAALALAKGPEGVALSKLFADQSDAADVWWRYLRSRHGDEPHRATLDRVARLLTPPPAPRTGDTRAGDTRAGGKQADAAPTPADAEWRKLVDSAASAAAALDAPQRAQWLRGLAETCLVQGDRVRAKELLAEAAPLAAAAVLRLADVYAEDAAWSEAAVWYAKVTADADQRPLAMFLRGRALEKAGDAAEGRRLMQLARMLPLADGAKRRVLADGLKERKLTEQAVAEWELVLRSTAFRDWYGSNASLNLGNTLSGKDQLAAAANWEALALSVLKTSSSFLEVDGYLQLPHLVHKSRARGLLAEGKHAEALENLRISQAAYPGNIDLAEDLIPELEAAGQRGAADDLFAKVFRPNEQVCADFPDNASAHNNLAWLAARSGRKLDEALLHARRAVALEPENAAYLDTLAEALFRTGSRVEAIELALRCLEKEPENEHFKQQLSRFSAGR